MLLWLRLGLDRKAASKTRVRRTALQHIEICTWSVLFFLMTSPFTYLLMGVDPANEARRNLISNRREEGSQILLYGLRYAVLGMALLLVLQRRHAGSQTLVRIGPVLPYMLWAILSLAWTDEPQSTIHGLMALLPVFVVPYAASVCLSLEDSARAILFAGLLVAVASLLFMVVMPSQGLHQIADQAQSVHAGAWRGIYMHKNHLGQAMALFAACFVAAGREVVRSPWLKWGGFALMVTMVLGSQSKSALVIIPVALVFAATAVRLTMFERFFALAYIGAVGAGAMLAANVLLNLLGRDMTLSGRTTIWEIATNFILARPLHGYGYMSTSYGGFSYAVSAKVNVYDPHNGFFDTLLGLGGIGLVCLLGPALLAIARARRQYLGSRAAASGAMVLATAMAAWLVACMTESNVRPLGSVSVLGMMAMVILLLERPPPIRRSARQPSMADLLDPDREPDPSDLWVSGSELPDVD